MFHSRLQIEVLVRLGFHFVTCFFGVIAFFGQVTCPAAVMFHDVPVVRPGPMFEDQRWPLPVLRVACAFFFFQIWLFARLRLVFSTRRFVTARSQPICVTALLRGRFPCRRFGVR